MLNQLYANFGDEHFVCESKYEAFKEVVNMAHMMEVMKVNEMRYKAQVKAPVVGIKVLEFDRQGNTIIADSESYHALQIIQLEMMFNEAKSDAIYYRKIVEDLQDALRERDRSISMLRRSWRSRSRSASRSRSRTPMHSPQRGQTE